MECLIVEQQDVSEERRELILRGEEAHHAVKALRIREGEELLVSNLIGTCYRCRLREISQERREVSAVCMIEEALHGFGEAANNIKLIQGVIAQPARWEFLLEKATELGVRVIQPVTTEYSESRGVKEERSERILRAAVKQTKRANKPQLTELSSLEEALTKSLQEGRRIFMLHESAPADHLLLNTLPQTLERLAIVVGPEGGFSEKEVALAKENYHAEIVSLGGRRLRAETAAMAALAIAVR